MSVLGLAAALAAGAPGVSQAVDVVQVRPVADPRVEPSQVTPPGPQPQVVTRQVNTSERSAAPAPALSTPAQGRRAAPATPLTGQDACAPSPGGAPSAPKICDHPIETRAADFSRAPPAPLTAEQRLLVQQQTGVLSPDEAARRLGGAQSDRSEAAQAVAAAITAKPPEPEPKTSPYVVSGPGVDAVLNALLGAPLPH